MGAVEAEKIPILIKELRLKKFEKKIPIVIKELRLKKFEKKIPIVIKELQFCNPSKNDFNLQ